MFVKKKRLLDRFGKSIEESCVYCQFNASDSAEDGDVICTVNGAIKKGRCKKYRYNPLMRAPRKKIEVSGSYTEEDFKL